MSSDLKVTNIKHESSSSNNLVLASDGTTTVNGALTASGGIKVADGGNIGSVSDTDAISISSAGYVIDSRRPYFWVRGDHGSEDIGNNNRFPFNQITTDNGNHWNTTGYFFTTPVAGLYFFTAQLYWYNNIDSIDVEIDSSNTSDSDLVSLGRIIYDPRASDMIFHVRALCYLSANRRVSVRNKAGGNRSWYFNDAGRHTSFQGCLIG